MKRYKIIYLSVVLTIILTGCATQRGSTIVGDKYDENKNQTEYFVLPYGTVSMSGKWEKTHYNSISGQQFFINNDSIKTAIAFQAFNNYEFNTNGSLTGFDFVKAFYEWESKYFVETYGLNRSLIEKDSISNYIIWRLSGTANNGKFDSYFLFGEKNRNASNFSIMLTDKWTEGQKIDFLKNLFLSKNNR